MKEINPAVPDKPKTQQPVEEFPVPQAKHIPIITDTLGCITSEINMWTTLRSNMLKLEKKPTIEEASHMPSDLYKELSGDKRGGDLTFLCHPVDKDCDRCIMHGAWGPPGSKVDKCGDVGSVVRDWSDNPVPERITPIVKVLTHGKKKLRELFLEDMDATIRRYIFTTLNQTVLGDEPQISGGSGVEYWSPADG